MPSDEASRPTIPPVPAGEPRPLWSVMIPTYNCAGYLRETILSVLAQDPGPETMQIEVVDDASTGDDPESVVADVGAGRVSFHRQPHNVGHTRNFNTCLTRARGHLVHLLHGDDAVVPGFYETLARGFQAAPRAGAAFCRDVRIDEEGRTVSAAYLIRDEPGIVDGWLERIAAGQLIQPPAMAVRRSVYEALGGFDERITCYGEDWEMWVRIAAHYPVWYDPAPLARYRVHGKSLTSASVRTGAHAADYRRVIAMNRMHLPPDRADAVSREATISFARACMRRGWRAMGTGNGAVVASHFREGMRTSRSWRVFVEFVDHGLRFVGRQLVHRGSKREVEASRLGLEQR